MVYIDLLAAHVIRVTDLEKRKKLFASSIVGSSFLIV